MVVFGIIIEIGKMDCFLLHLKLYIVVLYLLNFMIAVDLNYIFIMNYLMK